MYLADASVILVLEATTAVRMCVQCCAINVETTLMANVNATQAGKVKIAVLDTTNVKSLIATDTGNAPMANAFVYEDSRANSAKKLIVHIQPAMVTDSVWKAHVSAKRDGKELTAVRLTKMLFNVFLIALVMESLTWKPKPATVIHFGPAMTALENFAIWTVVLMGIALVKRVLVTWDGVANTAM